MRGCLAMSATHLLAQTPSPTKTFLHPLLFRDGTTAVESVPQRPPGLIQAQQCANFRVTTSPRSLCLSTQDPWGRHFRWVLPQAPEADRGRVPQLWELLADVGVDRGIRGQGGAVGVMRIRHQEHIVPTASPISLAPGRPYSVLQEALLPSCA